MVGVEISTEHLPDAMLLEDLETRYPHSEWTLKPNKKKFPKTTFCLDQLDEFNEIYFLLRDTDEIRYIPPTDSGGMPYCFNVRDNHRYTVHQTKVAVEIILCHEYIGCYRWILKMGNLTEQDEVVRGSDALTEIINVAKRYEVYKTFTDNILTTDEGKQVKSEIESPIIDVDRESYIGHEFSNVHHLDFNSSYWSRIVEKHEELRPMIEYLYDKRHERDGYYKSVLTNSVGAMQSQYCYDITEEKLWKRAPYQLASFAKEAINGNNDLVREYELKLLMNGRTPLMYNTDGIWYQGDLYEDERFGKGLGQIKNDHKNCRLYIKSAGAYQYIEDGKVNSVVRGHTSLDTIKPDRDTWLWREIDKFDEIDKYKFVKGQGVIRYEK